MIVRRSAAGDGTPSVERLVGPAIAALQLISGQSGWLEDGVARVVAIPMLAGDTALTGQSLMERRAWVRREDVKRRRLDAMLNRPVNRALEHRLIITAHAEHDTAVDHPAEIVETPDGGGVVAAPLIRFDLATGSRRVVKHLQPADLSGVNSIIEFAITPDGRAYFYSYGRLLSQLYLVTGLR